MENVAELARIQGRRLKSVSCDEVNKHMPYFTLERNSDRAYKARAFNYRNHPNADRMGFLTCYLQQHVCPYVVGDMSGLFQIELHDVYDKDKYDTTNTLVWSKYREDEHVILMPDIYHLIDFCGKLKTADLITYENKKDKMCFFGSSTGSTDLRKNERVIGCTWGSSHADVADFFITRKVQMDENTIIPGRIMCPPVAQSKILDYKFCCNIEGNTNCWDRVPVIMASNSLLFQMPSEFMSFYEPLIHTGIVNINHYDQLPEQMMYYVQNTREAQRMIMDANEFARTYLQAEVAQHYMVNLFQAFVDTK